MAHIGIELTLLSAFQESENLAFVPCILKYSSDLHISLIPVPLLGSLCIEKRCFGSRNSSTFSNPFANEGFSVTAEKWQQQGMF